MASFVALAEEMATSGSIMPWIPGEVIERIVKAIPYSSHILDPLPYLEEPVPHPTHVLLAVAGRFAGVIP